VSKLSDEEKATLEALNAKANAADDDDDFEVEWWEEDEGGKRKGGRVPWKTGKKMYGSYFPDLFGDKPPENAPPEGGKIPPKRTSEKYFGRGDKE
jgi:hypothetical protein